MRPHRGQCCHILLAVPPWGSVIARSACCLHLRMHALHQQCSITAPRCNGLRCSRDLHDQAAAARDRNPTATLAPHAAHSVGAAALHRSEAEIGVGVPLAQAVCAQQSATLPAGHITSPNMAGCGKRPRTITQLLLLCCALPTHLWVWLFARAALAWLVASLPSALALFSHLSGYALCYLQKEGCNHLGSSGPSQLTQQP